MENEIFTANEVCQIIGLPYWRLHYAETNDRLPFKARRFRKGKRYFTQNDRERLRQFFGLSGARENEQQPTKL